MSYPDPPYPPFRTTDMHAAQIAFLPTPSPSYHAYIDPDNSISQILSPGKHYQDVDMMDVRENSPPAPRVEVSPLPDVAAFKSPEDSSFDQDFEMDEDLPVAASWPDATGLSNSADSNALALFEELDQSPLDVCNTAFIHGAEEELLTDGLGLDCLHPDLDQASSNTQPTSFIEDDASHTSPSTESLVDAPDPCHSFDHTLAFLHEPSHFNSSATATDFHLETSHLDSMDLDEAPSTALDSALVNNAHTAIYNEGTTAQDLLTELISVKLPAFSDDSFLLPSSSPRGSSPSPLDASNIDMDTYLYPSSSPVRSSTPDLMFSSSPVRTSSPTTSPGQHDKDERVARSSPPRGRMEATKDLKPIKRTRSATDNKEEPALKRKKSDVSRPPQPTRNTVASQRIQYKKLKTPFRSPVTFTTKDVRYSQPEIKREVLRQNLMPPPPAPSLIAEPKITGRLTAQFKSPLAPDGTQNAVSIQSVAPNIQALQRRLQLLKRAVRIKNEGDEEKLSALVRKWTDVGREVAWDVWAIVKENIVSPDSGTAKGGWDDRKKSGFGESWGWKESESMINEEAEEKDVKEDTMGTMLRQMQIDPETLGWDEEEGEFADGRL